MNALGRLVADAITAMRAKPQMLRAVFFGALVLFVLYDVYAPRHEAHFAGDNVRGFWAIFGYLGCWGMARFMKGIGHAWLMKKPNYWTTPEGEG
ncbi:MAG: hypothetical protein HZB55_15355 [Deltaproteobacteria bacterium]|nr:hypothetical protein [Deltaproteobacteria bacterium]